MHVDLQLIHLLFMEASSEMVSVEGWLSRTNSQGKERKGWGVPNYTRVIDNKSQQVWWTEILQPSVKHSWVSVIKQKAANTQNRALNVPQEAWKTIPADYLKK